MIGGKFKTKTKKGFTLIELLSAVGIFGILMGLATGVFVSALKLQKQSFNSQEILSQTSYLMEYISRAIRMAKKDNDGGCTGESGWNFVFENNCLKFKNYKNECQSFCLENERLKEKKGQIEAYLTSKDISVKKFNVFLKGEKGDDDLQPRVTIFIEMTKKNKTFRIQTTVSQRNLDL